MPVIIKCPDCGHAEESDDGATRTCPECEGTMAAPPKKKYQAKTTSLEEEERASKKSKRRDDDDDEEPKAKKKPRDDEDETEDDAPRTKKKRRDNDEEDEDERPKAKKSKPAGEKSADGRDGKAAESLGIKTGFKNKELMAQVEAELKKDEVLHWAGRMCPELVQKSGVALRIVGVAFACMGLLFCVITLVVLPGFLKLASVFPLIFVGIGAAAALFLPGVLAKQATRAWYAVTDDRAIVYTPSFFGSGGKVESYLPKDLRKMWVKQSKSLPGAGDLVFKTKIGVVHTKNGSRKEEIHYGFLNIEDVNEVETLIHKVLIGDIEDDDDD